MVWRHRLGILGGIEIDAVNLKQAVERCESSVSRSREPLVVGCYNAAKVVSIQSDSKLRDAINPCKLILADGQSVVWAAKLLHAPIKERVTGIDLFEALLVSANQKEHEHSIYLLGATEEVLQKLINHIHQVYPRISIAGSRNGYFDQSQEAEVVDAIRDAQPDYLFVGMPSPRKEFFLARWSGEMGVPVCHGVGGSFDVMAGLVKRAPLWMQRFGLEWFYRFIQEPRRLWRRYLVTNTRFIWLVIKAWWKS